MSVAICYLKCAKASSFANFQFFLSREAILTLRPYDDGIGQRISATKPTQNIVVQWYILRGSFADGHLANYT